MLRRFVCLALFVPLFAQKEDPSEGWIQLFDGASLYGWVNEGGANWSVKDGAITAESGQRGWLRSHVPLADYRLRMEFKIAPGTSSGLYLRSGLVGDPGESGYRVVIGDATPRYLTGSLDKHARSSAGKLRAGEWHVFDITARGPQFVVRLDGKEVLRAKSLMSSYGYFGLQYTGGKVAFRNLRLRPLDFACLFSGVDLKGWRTVESPTAKTKAEWLVRDGMLHVEGGPGQLETEQAWDNFVLQIDVRVNASSPDRHPNSGIFFRGDRGLWWSGYESQIRNEYEGGDPDKPVDFGTGGIYRRQPARRIVAKDNQWFTKTIIAAGRRMGVWVDGVMVNAYEDKSPEGLNVRGGQARLLPGTISLQAHDPTTNLDFKSACIAPLPRMGDR